MSTQPNALSRSRAVLALEYPMSLGRYDTYDKAQRAVDYLSDHEFPVQNVLIVGTDLKQLERVTGRLTRGRAALGGLVSGAWLGLFVGFIVAVLDTQSGAGFTGIIATVALGAVFGVVWSLIGFQIARGPRDFTSVMQVVATQYEVLVEHKFAVQARELLTQMDPAAAAQAQAQVQLQANLDAARREQGHGGHQPPAS